MSGNPLPDQWSRRTLRELATINYGRDPSAILNADGQYPVYGTSGNERFGTAFLYDGDSVVLGRKGTIDRVHYATGRFWTIDTAYFLSKFKDAIPKWLFYSLASIDLRSLNEATGVPSLSRDLLYKINVLTPPGAEQSKIAEILSTVDRAIEQTEALIAKQQRIKTGLMQDLLTRGIDEHGNLRSEQTHEFKDSPLGRIPVEWDCVQFGSCMATNPTNGIYKPQSAYAEAGVPIVRIDGYRNGDRIEGQTFKCLVLSIPEMMRYALKAGDLLVNRVNSIDYLGKSALVGDLPQATVFESNMMRLRVDKQQLLPDFAIRVLSSSVAFRDFQRLAKIAIAQTSINQQDVCSLWLKKPCIEEQTRIVQVASACDACIGELSGRQRKLRHIKTALMQDLLTGKRRVTALLSKTEARA